MVQYSTWVSVAFAEAEAQGFEKQFESNNDVVSVAADIWNDRKDELQQVNRRTARQIASDEIQVA